MKMATREASFREVPAMYSAIPKGKGTAWFRSAPKRSWFAGVLILALCVPAISACSAGGNGEGEAGVTVVELE